MSIHIEECFSCPYFKYADGGCQYDHLVCFLVENDPFLVALEDYDESDF